ncbi:MAG: S8 family serine peptidase [Lachnospiraceae bacterium]|nr:S8 family serine peptidase [Lachnospiraceae bacterium]
MGKLSKRALALLLAGAMAFMPTADILAADNADNIDLTVMETEDITQESDATETDDSTVETENNTDSSSVEGEENTDSETGDKKDDNSTGLESGNIDNSDIENDSGLAFQDNDNSDSDTDTETDDGMEDNNADIQDSGIESNSETDDLDSEEVDSEQASDTESEEEFPGLVNSALSAKQLEDRNDLAAHLDEINSGIEGTDYVNRELLFAANTLAEAEKIAAAYGAELKDFVEGIGVLILPEDISVSHALTVAAKSTDVVLPPAWPNYIYKICGDIDEDIDIDDAADVDVPDEVYANDDAYEEAVKAYSDPYLDPTSANYQYQHAMVGSTYAWNAGYKGQGIKIAILDTGVNSSHSDLNVVYNYNFTSSQTTDAGDGHGHGTHVAGLAAAKIDGKGGAGIAPEASIYNIRVLASNGAGTAAAIIRGINHAVAQQVDIINMSLGGPGYLKEYDEAINKAYNAGIIVISAAGNDGSKVKCYPACYKNSLCVGAVDENKGRTYFSNYGSWVNLSAPGLSLFSTSKSGGYEKMSGTSQATPVVSGTAAVILSADESIRNKTGKARVNALISKMNKGKISGSGGAAGIVSLAKALNIPVSTAAPKAPAFVQTDKTVNGASLSVSIKPASTTDVIYYSTDGKNPTYKNGILSDNAQKYEKAFSISGSAKITVKAIAVNACGMVSKPASITYTFKPHATAITITGQNVLLKGKSMTLKAEVEPSYAVNKKVTWTSSAPSEVSVTTSGKVTATKSAVVGSTYTITAKSADQESKATEVAFKITVKDTATISSVAFKNEAGKVQKSAVITNAVTDYDLAPLLKVTGTDNKENQSLVNEVVFSSSNTQVAKIDGTKHGNIKIVGVGKAVITAAANDGSGKKATFTLTVGKKLTKLSIDGLSLLAQGKSIKLTVLVNRDAANKKLDWSVSPADKGVTVSNGTVKAAKNATSGAYTITAMAKDGSGLKATKNIKISEVKITKIQLDNKSGTIFRVAGNYSSTTSINISATITGGQGSDVEFISSNTSVATVTQNGAAATIKAGKITGTAKITCKAANGKSASCTIKVVNPPSRLAITSKAGFSNSVAIGKKTKLSAVFEEGFGPVSSKKVAWTSLNPTVATVDKSGNVKGVKIGKATIKAVANDGSGLSAQYVVYVYNPIKTLKLYGFWESSLISTRFYVNRKYDDVTVLYNESPYPYDNAESVCPEVAIEVGNPDIVSLVYVAPGYYDLYTLKRGQTTITVKALDGSGVKKTYKIIVV